MALAGVQAITGSITPAYATPGSTEQISPTEDLFLHVKNASGGSINVTITDPGTTASGSAATNPVIAVPAAGERMIYLNQYYTSPSTGTITVAFSATASVTAALFRV
jgi:hypothetical protein